MVLAVAANAMTATPSPTFMTTPVLMAEDTTAGVLAAAAQTVTVTQGDNRNAVVCSCKCCNGSRAPYSRINHADSFQVGIGSL